MNTETKRKTKVFWTREEEQKLADFLVASGVSPDSRDLLPQARAAQIAVFPSSRRKTLSARDAILGVIAEMAAMYASPPVPEPEAAPEVVVEHGLSFGDELDGLLKELSKALVARFLDHFQKELSVQAKGRLSEIVRAVSPEVLVQRPRHPKVLIIGLQPQQAGIVQAEFGKDLDLRFWSDEDYGKLRSMAKASDYVISFLSNMGHKTTDCLKALNIKPEHNPGGLTTLKDRLTRIYITETER